MTGQVVGLEERLAAYLRAAGHEAAALRLGPRIGEGWSVDTFLVTAAGERLVLRLAGADHPLRTDPAREARVMALAGEAGVPVPRVVAAEDDPEWLGAPFSLVAFADGEAPNVWSARRMLRLTEESSAEAVLDDVAGLAHAIRRVPVQAATAEPPSLLGMAAGDYAVRADVERWEALLDGTSRPREALAAAGRWLADNAPPTAEVVFQHHDFRLGNLLFGAGGRALAVLDWEFSGAGDPLCDIGYAAQPYALGKLLRRAPSLDVPGDPTAWLLRAYAERAPDPVDPERQRWFVALGIFKMAIALVLSADRWWRGEGDRRDRWLELPILSLTEDLVLAIRAQV